MSDPETIRVYDSQAAEYAGLTDEATAEDPQLRAFIDALPAGGRVLDLGCGPGQAAALMAASGLQADATDASSEMVAMAAAHPGVTAWQATFDDIAGEDLYDGIWASFCLLHAPRADMPRHLAALKHALKPGGTFYIGLKTGDGEHRDSIGRLYTYYQPQELDHLLKTAGFTPQSHRTGRSQGLDGSMADWISVIAHG